MVVFDTMTQREAKLYLADFMAGLPAKIDAFRTVVEGSGGPAATELDLSVESLDPLWAWLCPQWAWREGYVPAPKFEVPTKVDLSTVEPEDQLPDWFGDWPEKWGQYSTTTLWLIDGAARYLGETLVRAAVPPAKWKAGFARQKRYIYQNRPVVSSPDRDDYEPFGSVGGMVRSFLTDDGVESLRDSAERWLNGPVKG